MILLYHSWSHDKGNMQYRYLHTNDFIMCLMARLWNQARWPLINEQSKRMYHAFTIDSLQFYLVEFSYFYYFFENFIQCTLISFPNFIKANFLLQPSCYFLISWVFYLFFFKFSAICATLIPLDFGLPCGAQSPYQGPQPQVKLTTPSPSHQLPIALQQQVGLYAYHPFPCWILQGLNLSRPCARCCKC